jgi:hypothetical protein
MVRNRRRQVRCFPAPCEIGHDAVSRRGVQAEPFALATITHSYLFNLPAALRSLPVLSIVTATNHLYGSSGILGIQGGTYSSGPWQPIAPGDYHNPSKHGLAWERPVSVEWIRPEDNSGFQVDCGIRVHGSDYQRPRLTPSSKFSFRLYFRNDYGPGRLKYPLFPLTPVQDFDQLVLRAGFNEQGNPFIRDELHRRLSHDMGQIASHGNLAVVFVTGVITPAARGIIRANAFTRSSSKAIWAGARSGMWSGRPGPKAAGLWTGPSRISRIW